MYARDCDNKSVWILGPIRVMRPDTSVVGNVPIWDPKKKLIPPPDLKKLPRPQNAYILYRKDIQSKVKADNPNLHNNEICKPHPSNVLNISQLTTLSGSHWCHVEERDS